MFVRVVAFTKTASEYEQATIRLDCDTCLSRGHTWGMVQVAVPQLNDSVPQPILARSSDAVRSLIHRDPCPDERLCAGLIVALVA